LTSIETDEIVSNLNRRLSKQITGLPFGMRKVPSGLNDYINNSNHPIITPRMFEHDYTGNHNSSKKLSDKNKKEYEDTLTGIKMQLKSLVTESIGQERIKSKLELTNHIVLGDDVIKNLHLNSSAVKASVQKSFEALSQIYRHLLRTMVKLDRENESVANVLTTVWKLITFFIDTILDVNKNDIEDAISKIEKDYSLKKQGMDDFMEAYVKKYETKDKQLRVHFERLKQENHRIETVSRDREHQLQLLSNPEGVKKYKDLLNGFSDVLLENQKEKQSQLSTMGQMLNMMKECKLEVPKENAPGYSKRHKISNVNLSKLMKAQETVSQSNNQSPMAKSASMIDCTVTPVIRTLRFDKQASQEVPEDYNISSKFKF